MWPHVFRAGGPRVVLLDEHGVNTQATVANTVPMLRAMGAQMGPVGGGFLNVHSYGDVQAEHLNTRAHVGVQDLSTMGKIDVKGPEAVALVNHLIVNNAAQMRPGQARYASVCTTDGGIMDDLTVFRLADEHFLVVSGSRNRIKMRDWFSHHATGRRAYVTDKTAAIAFHFKRHRAVCRLQTLFH